MSYRLYSGVWVFAGSVYFGYCHQRGGQTVGARYLGFLVPSQHVPISVPRFLWVGKCELSARQTRIASPAHIPGRMLSGYAVLATVWNRMERCTPFKRKYNSTAQSGFNRRLRSCQLDIPQQYRAFTIACGERISAPHSWTGSDQPNSWPTTQSLDSDFQKRRAFSTLT